MNEDEREFLKEIYDFAKGERIGFDNTEKGMEFVKKINDVVKNQFGVSIFQVQTVQSCLIARTGASKFFKFMGELH
jgi:hypothetical protein